MSTHEGWVLSNMWYDTCGESPTYKSPRETLFILVYLKRQQTALLSTRALVQTSLQSEKEAQDPAVEAFQKYYDAMFPFLENADPAQDEMHKALEAFTKVTSAKIPLKPIWAAQAEAGKRAMARQRALSKRKK